MLISYDGVQQQYSAIDGERAEHRARIRNQPWMTPDEFKEWQLGALNRVVEHARRDVPFYSGRLPHGPFESFSDFTQRVPTLARSELSRAGHLLHSRDLAENEVVELRTGGTSGDPLTIWCTTRALARHYAAFARFREWIGVRDDARVAVFGGRTTIGGGELHVKAPDNPRVLLCSADGFDGDSVARYVDALVQFVPDVIDGFPSVLAPIARYVRAHDVRGIHPDAVITSGDLLAPATRRLLEEAFRAPVFDHYGSAEMVAQVTECRAGSYHVNSDYGFVEVLRDGRAALPGESGEIVATGFLNYASPLIRYETGDLAVAGTSHCPCGRTFPTIERFLGRADEGLIAPDGHVVARIDRVLRSVNSLIETRLVQDAPDHVTVEAVVSGVADPMEVASLIRELRTRLGPGMKVDLVRVPRIARTSSGRFRSIQRFESPQLLSPVNSRAVV